MPLKLSIGTKKNAHKALASSPSVSSEETTAALREVVSGKTMSSAIATPSSLLEPQESSTSVFSSEVSSNSGPFEPTFRYGCLTYPKVSFKNGIYMSIC